MGGRDSIAVGVGVAGVLVLFAFLLFRPAGALATAQEPLARGAYVGVASCAGTTCHGRSEGDGPVVRQDELMLWQDPSTAAGAHSRAYDVLNEPRSLAMARRVDGSHPTDEDGLCVGCHRTPAPPARQGTRFPDGVGCESCHGPAGGWLSTHYAVGGTHANNVRHGLAELEKPQVRARICLDCHFGRVERGWFVNHQMMAAGHPRISFELDLFTTLQQHHREDVDYGNRKEIVDSVRMWAIGQAIALQRSLTLFASPVRGSEGIFPEFYFFDCHSCHRRIGDNADFRPSPGNPGRPIPSGMPPYNDENMIMLAAAIRVLAPELAPRFDRDSQAFHRAMTRDRAAAVAAAGPLRDTARTLATAFADPPVTRAQTFAIIDSIASEAISPRFTDYAGSVQAVMAIDTLLSALVDERPGSEQAANAIRTDISAAYRAVRDPYVYDPGDFRASLGRAVAAIRRLR